VYHVITRIADNAVMDCRPETPGIADVLAGQVIATHGGTVEDYEISTSQTQVEVTDLRTAAEIEAAKWTEIRAERGRLLAESDMWGLADLRAAAGSELVAAWDTYRQLLRDIPQTYASDPDQVVWPDPPE
jgi:hypothetical protein